MQFTALSVVRQRIQVGMPLPFNVRDADKTLLLARGQHVESAEQLVALLERGALVDVYELLSPRERVMKAPREELPRMWQEGMQRVHNALLHAPHHSFGGALADACDPVVSLVERDPDLAIFQVLRQEGGAGVAYGVRRSLHTAITSHLVAQRLGWEPDACERAFKVALTSNLSMLELQGQLARQKSAPTAEQIEALRTHPMRSVELLELGGIRDVDWLQAVERHHEVEDGSGYPTGCTDVGDLASLVRRADVYTSKLASRSHRDALSADRAGREMFMQDPGHPMTAALVKEFGIYPPGCFVRLASGAVGLVVARGPSIVTPVVVCLSNERGVPLPVPVRVDTGAATSKVEAIVGESHLPFPVSPEKMVALTVG
jgi:hypothetical protein